MLVLSRKVGEAIAIGDDITVYVTDIRSVGGRARVKLGIDAPSDVSISRTELIEEERDGDASSVTEG
jgi:carbon storage regulator